MLNWPSQVELVHAIWVYGDVARDLMGTLSSAHFPQNPALGLLAETGVKCWEQYGKPPTVGQIRESIQGHPMEGAAVALMDDILTSSIPPVDWSIEKGRKHIAEVELEYLAASTKGLIEEGKHGEILSRVRNSLAIMSPKGQITVGAGTDDEILQRHTHVGECITTGIPTLDRHLGGGLQRGRTGCVLGGKGSGKSHTLVWLGTAAASAGYRVCYVSLEMSAAETRARFDRAITNLNAERLAASLADQMPVLREIHSRIRVVEGSRRPMSVNGFFAALDRIPLTEFPDLILLDYYQRMSGTQWRGDNVASGRIMDLSETSRTLHEIAQDRNLALWTAHQANRSGISAMKGGDRPLDTTAFAEAFAASYDFDVIVSINQTMLEAQDKVARLFLAENRNGANLVFVPVRFYKDRSRMEDNV